MTVNAITDTKKGRTGIAPTYLRRSTARIIVIKYRLWRHFPFPFVCLSVHSDYQVYFYFYLHSQNMFTRYNHTLHKLEYIYNHRMFNRITSTLPGSRKFGG